jgi:hypothetical protein
VNGEQAQLTRFAAGGDQVPLTIDGVSSLGRYMRSMSTNLSGGAGSQFDSLYRMTGC